MGYVIIIPLITNRKENMYLVISSITFNHNEDSYHVEAQDKDQGMIHEKLKALKLLNTNGDKTFHPLFIDVEATKKLQDQI